MNRPIRAAIYLPAIISIAFLLFSGCSGNSLMPDIRENASPASPTDTLSPSHQNLGFYLIEINRQSGQVDILPLRSASWHLNLVGVLNVTMGIALAVVPGESDPPNGIFALDITLTHPFAAKPQLAGFDVKGILITPGTLAVSAIKFADIDETRLLNADGYTRWWNAAEFTKPGVFGYIKGNLTWTQASALTAHVNPYKHFADILQATDDLSVLHSVALDDDQGRGVFSAGSSNTRRYRIKFPMAPGPQVVYGYAVDACWVAPSPNPPSEIPDDFPIDANQPEAYGVDIDIPVNALFYDTESGTGGGVFCSEVDVRDWQGTETGDVFAEVGVVRAYCPGLLADPIDFTATPDSIAGIAEYEAVQSATPTKAGDYLMPLRVESEGGPTYVQSPAPAPTGNISAWQVAEIAVVDPECEADSNNSMPEAEVIPGLGTFTGTLCGGTDDADYYRIDIPYGKQFGGAMEFYCGIPSASVSILRSDGSEIDSFPLDGYHRLTEDDLFLGSGTYYFVIQTTSSGIAGLYAIRSFFHLWEYHLQCSGEVTPPWLSLDANWLNIQENYLFLANEDFIWVYDITDNGNPLFMSRFETEKPMEVLAMYFPYLYYGSSEVDDHFIYVVDFTEPTAPVETFVWSTFNPVKFMCMDEEHLHAVFGSGTGCSLTIYDYVSNPLSPSPIGGLSIHDGTLVDMELMFHDTNDEALVMAYYDEGIYAYRIADPASVSLIDSVPNTLSFTHFITTTSDGYVLRINYGVISGDYHLTVLDFTDGDSLVPRGGFTFSDTPTSMEAYGDYIVVSSQVSASGSLVRVLDFSDPDNVVNNPGAATTPRSHVTYMHHNDDYIYLLAEHYDPRVAAITGGQLPDWGFEPFKSVNYPETSVFVGSNMYLACDYGEYAEHLSAIDVADPASALATRKRSMAADIDHFCGNSRILAWSRAGDQLYWNHPSGVSWSDEGHYNLSQDISAIAVTDTYMFVILKAPAVLKAYYIGGFPDSPPSQDYSGSVTYTATNLITHGDAMYGFVGDRMVIYNITVQEFPFESDTLGPFTDAVVGRVIVGDWLFLLTANELLVVDVSDPLNPDYQESLVLPHVGMSYLASLEGYVVAADPDHHPVFIDISIPTSPWIAGEPIITDRFWTISGLGVYEGYVYELCDSIGVRIFKMF